MRIAGIKEMKNDEKTLNIVVTMNPNEVIVKVTEKINFRESIFN
jgi:hypothetical protein